MENKEKLRKDIKDEYKWDLSPIYKSDELWYKDLEKVIKQIDKIHEYKNNFLDNGKNFYNYIKEDEKVERLLNKLFYYAHLNYDSDTTNDTYKVMYSKIEDVYNKYSLETSFVVPMILKLDDKKIESFYKDEEKLKEYKFMIDEIYRFKSHTLDEEKEKMLSSLSKCISNASDTYTSLIYSDITFDDVKDSNNNLLPLNESNYSLYMRSNDRVLRKNTFTNLFSKYSSLKNTITSCFSGNIEEHTINAKLRGYESAISASLYNDNVDKSIYDNLVKCVNDNLNVLYKYYDLKKEVLNLDELHLYDIYAELVNKSNKEYSYEEAKKIVLDALSVLGKDYTNVLNKAFNERWIDVYFNKGKRTGAYSSGNYDTNPYVLLNYEGTLDDVSTLAHELGHSMHTYLSCKNNPYQYSDYKIFVAEVASTVNEILLAKYMLKNSTDKDEKLNIINHIMELIKATLFRQTMFAEFERDMHEKRENGEILTPTNISDNYYELVKKYFGENVVCDDLIKYEWERIPHFYYNFYVYKYATGISAACYIADSILNNKENALEDYLKFLSSGGSMHPVDELKIAGVDIKDPNVIKSAINMLDDMIEEFKKIYNS